MTTLTWLHLSDLHLRDAETSVDRVHFDGLLEDIKALRQKEKLNPDVVFFTGDVAFSGQAAQYNLAAKWFDEILQVCSLPGQRDRFFIVPGNHDVDRSIVSRTTLSAKQHENFATDLLNFDNCQAIDDFLKCELDRKWAFEKFSGFGRFVAEFFGDKEIEFDHNRYYFAATAKFHLQGGFA